MSFFERFRPRPAAAARVPDGNVVWAIGDIHGRADLLMPLLETVREDAGRARPLETVLILLGDYVDRGPNSAAVLDILSRLNEDKTWVTHTLLGNHEDRMAAFLADPTTGEAWCRHGGRETLASYGVIPPCDDAGPEAWSVCSANLNSAMPEAHRHVIERGKTHVLLGDYVFVHAGVRPGIPLSEQSTWDQMWIREPFLSHPAPCEKVVVHGHSPTEKVVSDARRIGLDTGAYASSVLSAARLEKDERTLVQASRNGGEIEISTKPLSIGTAGLRSGRLDRRDRRHS